MEFYVEIGYTYTTNPVWYINYLSIITNLVMFEVMADKFNMVEIRTSETHELEWNVELYGF